MVLIARQRASASISATEIVQCLRLSPRPRPRLSRPLSTGPSVSPSPSPPASDTGSRQSQSDRPRLVSGTGSRVPFSTESFQRLVSNEEYKKRIAEWSDTLIKKKKELAIQADRNFSLIGVKVNEVTGYREVEQLKQEVRAKELELSLRREEVRAAKVAYEEAVTTRSSSQQDVNALLERKHSWSDSDVASFTTLVRSDHASRHAVSATSEQLRAAEMAVDKAFTSLMRAILERYHEEQVWSDKIRSVSTWAGLVALAANLVVFVGAIAFIEPWKRRRLVQGLEEQISGMMMRVEGGVNSLSEQLGKLNDRTPPVAIASTTPETSVSPLPQASLHLPILSASPIEQLSDTLISPATPTWQSSCLSWTSSQLSSVAPPSIERDLTAVGIAGAIGGIAIAGLINAMIWAMRGRA